MNTNGAAVIARALVAAACLVWFGAPARADLHIDITKGTQQPIPIAITDLIGTTPDAQRMGHDISQVISADLERSGLFRPIEQGAFVQQADTIGIQPRFQDWRLINAQALVSGSASMQPDGRLHAEFRLWDVFAEAQMEGEMLATQSQSWRRIAHKIADAIYKRITGESGYFDTEIVYIAESGPATRRIKRLAIMDQDGANVRVLTDGRALVLTPRFSPTTREITYMSYFNDRPRVYLFNIDTGQQEVVGDFPGMTFAPRFSPDGNKVVMSLAIGGNSDIYELDLRTKQKTQLTNTRAIDVSPCYSPDGRRITFASDRGGSPQIYVMNADGSNPQRITFGNGRYTTPVWSPRGDLIAFTKQEGGQFSIGVMSPDGKGERILSSSYLDEGPTWAPNGRVLMFFRESPSDASGRGGSTRLYTVDITGQNLREVVTPTDASDPAWSPLIP
ncbi:MAG TPA: Tol-Pal system beta propeller repeat protein TolB [Candidatus Sulfotelmatobacter sp.]|nr:Tol-Pal system beta propeller repeat protein TolB [Candidatus Sulfotelmatobacter sp.]